jgi:lipopolysaccharide biosynthesis regulator YciM
MGVPQSFSEVLDMQLNLLNKHPWKKYDLAIEQYKFLLKDQNLFDGVIFTPLTICYAAADKTQNGINFFNKLSSKYPENADLKICLAVLEKQNDEKTTAVQHLQIILDEKLGTQSKRDYVAILLSEWQKEKK